MDPRISQLLSPILEHVKSDRAGLSPVFQVAAEDEVGAPRSVDNCLCLRIHIWNPYKYVHTGTSDVLLYC